METQLRDKWVAALRSGEYLQTRGQLQAPIDDRDEDSSIGYCCLGVLCDVGAKEGLVQGEWLHNSFAYERDGFDDYGDSLDNAVDGELDAYLCSVFGLTEVQQSELARRNDGASEYTSRDGGITFPKFHQHSFAEIANWIEENL